MVPSMTVPLCKVCAARNVAFLLDGRKASWPPDPVRLPTVSRPHRRSPRSITRVVGATRRGLDGAPATGFTVSTRCVSEQQHDEERQTDDCRRANDRPPTTLARRLTLSYLFTLRRR